MHSPMVGVRVPESLESAARARAPELESLTPSELLRAALAFLAGYPVRDAARLARGIRGQLLTMPEPSELPAAGETQPA